MMQFGSSNANGGKSIKFYQSNSKTGKFVHTPQVKDANGNFVNVIDPATNTAKKEFYDTVCGVLTNVVMRTKTFEGKVIPELKVTLFDPESNTDHVIGISGPTANTSGGTLIRVLQKLLSATKAQAESGIAIKLFLTESKDRDGNIRTDNQGNKLYDCGVCVRAGENDKDHELPIAIKRQDIPGINFLSRDITRNQAEESLKEVLGWIDASVAKIQAVIGQPADAKPADEVKDPVATDAPALSADAEDMPLY